MKITDFTSFTIHGTPTQKYDVQSRIRRASFMMLTTVRLVLIQYSADIVISVLYILIYCIHDHLIT